MAQQGWAQVIETRQSPVVFTAAGTIINSGSHYVIPLRLDVPSLLLEIEPLERSLRGAYSHYTELANLIGGEGRAVDALEYFPLSLRDHTTL